MNSVSMTNQPVVQAVNPPSRSGVLVSRISRALRHRYELLLRKLSRARHFELTLVEHHLALASVREHYALMQRVTLMDAPRLYDQELAEIRLPALEVTGPDLHFLELTPATVVGGSMAVMQAGRLLHPELLHTKAVHEDKAPDICRFGDAKRRTVTLRGFSRRSRRQVPLGVHLLKEHAQNYYHWMFECMPRLLFFRDHWRLLGIDVKPVLLIEHELFPQLREALQLQLDFPHEIQTVRRGEVVECERLFYVSPFWYSLDNSENPVEPEKDYVVDRQAVAMIRSAYQHLQTPGPATRKLYIPRLPGQLRRIINTPEVEAVLLRHGFETVQPHLLSFREQVAMFSQARVVLGASGAAFSNLAFMPAGSQAVIISPKQLGNFNYYIFQQQADVAGVELAHLLARPEREQRYHVHNDFRVDCVDLERLVSRLG